MTFVGEETDEGRVFFIKNKADSRRFGEIIDNLQVRGERRFIIDLYANSENNLTATEVGELFSLALNYISSRSEQP